MPEPMIEASGHPLVYRSRPPTGAIEGPDLFYRVEAHSLDGMQKEGFVSLGRKGAAWRLTTDESLQLRGQDAAPQPLAIYCATKHAIEVAVAVVEAGELEGGAVAEAPAQAGLQAVHVFRVQIAVRQDLIAEHAVGEAEIRRVVRWRAEAAVLLG